MKILIVEDDLISRLKLEAILSSDDKMSQNRHSQGENNNLSGDEEIEQIRLSDCEMVFTDTGHEAIEIAKSKPHPDLILLDVMLPGIDGYQVCRELKKDAITRNIPVIFATAKTDEKNEAIGFELGAVDYITKPYRNSIVKNRVRVHLELNGFLVNSFTTRRKSYGKYYRNRRIKVYS